MEYKFLFSYVLVIIAILYSYKEKLEVEKQLFINSIRALIQLLILGYVLLFIFQIKNPIYLILVLIVMILFASYTGQKRVKLKEKGIITAFVCMFSASFIVLFPLIYIGVVSLKPNEIIPVGGMIIGNSLNVYTLTVDKLKGEIKNNIDLIENFVALGTNLKEAIHSLRKTSVKSALIPIFNLLQTVGIIHIPGITTGMLLAGANPLKAISYQLAILYMIIAVSLFTSVITVSYAYKKIFISAIKENLQN